MGKRKLGALEKVDADLSVIPGCFPAFLIDYHTGRAYATRYGGIHCTSLSKVDETLSLTCMQIIQG